MPEARYFTVTEERKVRIRAAEPLDAAKLATAVFAGESITEAQPDIEGAILTQIKVTDLVIREDL